MCSLQEQQFLHCREKFDGWVYNFTWKHLNLQLFALWTTSILLYLTDHASSPQPSLPPLLIISLVKTVIIFFWTHTLMEPLASFTDHHPRYLLLAVRNLRIVLHYHWGYKLQQRRKYQHWHLLWNMTTNVDALPDDKIIVNIISQLHIEPGGHIVKIF